MAASWSRSRTLGAKHKVFSWRIDNRGNLFIKRKLRNKRFPRIDKISCRHLERLCGFMQDGEWKALASDAAKLCTGAEREGIGKFLYKLRPEVSYAQLSSQLGAVFYQAGVWEWNEQKRGMEFLLLSRNWQEKITEYYKNSLNFDKDSLNSGENVDFLDNVLEARKEDVLKKQKKQQDQVGRIEIVSKIEQMKLSAFFRN